MPQTTLQSDAFERFADEYALCQPPITKFRSPLSERMTQTRTRLLTHLQHGLLNPLVLISAPAGSGKTTMLSQWIQSLVDEHVSVAWLSLDTSDNEPIRFWNVVFTALVQKLPVFGPLEGKREAGSITDLLTLLINIGAAQQERIVLVLDDYHTITDNTIQKQMAYLIEHLPPHMHIVLSTRVDPYLPLARLRVRRQVLEVRMDTLRFTCEEATLFLQEVMHLSLNTAEIIYLVDHVDGWIAGLHLAGCALHEPCATESVSVAARGSQRYILDYILEEILSSLDEHMQTFLLRTAFLPHFSASLCDAVLDRQDSWQILQRIERAHLFLVAEDHEHTIYHYQTLFAEALRSHLERTESDLVPVLHRRASQWYEQHGFLIDAIEHLCEAQDWEKAAILIERMMQQQCTKDAHVPSLTTLQNLLVRLPEAKIQLRPLLHNCSIAFELKEQNIPVVSSPYEKEVHGETQAQQDLLTQNILDPLSMREVEVLCLMARGDSNRDIANDLIIAPATVKRHVSNILSKLQAANRTQAVAFARHNGILA